MNITDKNRNLFFWILQFAGWGFLNSLSIFVLKNVSFEFLLYSFLGGLFIGVFSTSLLRWYLKKSIFFEQFGWKELLKIVLSTITAAAIFGGLNIVFGYVYVKLGPSLSSDELDLMKIYDSKWLIVFSSIFNVFAWVICYLGIKLLLKFNSSRIERLELNTNLKQAQLNTLKGQINPHFMFNSLNNIRGLMLEDVDRSREMLTKLSEMLRYSLTKNNINAIALEEELEMVDNYIDLSKIQFEDRLEFVKEVQKDCLQVQIPPMLIQLLVENAAKHGISKLKDGGKISLKVHKENNELLIKVSNTGKLSISKDSTQLGLNNIRQRLKLLYVNKAQFKLEEISKEVVATINIPLL